MGRLPRAGYVRAFSSPAHPLGGISLLLINVQSMDPSKDFWRNPNSKEGWQGMNVIWGSHQNEDAKLELLDKASGYCVSGSFPEARNLMTAICPVTWSYSAVHRQ